MDSTVIQKFADSREWCRQFINENALYRVAPWEKPITAKLPGGHYHWQFYTRRATHNAIFSHLVGAMFWLLFADEYKNTPFQIGGCESAGESIACAITSASVDIGINVNMFTIKKERKAYGLYNWTEGIIDPDLPVLLVDDVAASQNTLLQNKYLLERSGYKIYDKYFCILDKRGEKCPGHPENLLDLTLVALFTTDNFDLSWNDYVKAHGKEPGFRYNF